MCVLSGTYDHGVLGIAQWLVVAILYPHYSAITKHKWQPWLSPWRPRFNEQFYQFSPDNTAVASFSSGSDHLSWHAGNE